MSSERTMSVVGSEVMPLEYGGMDSESSPSSSSLERIVEERRERGVVEEEEEEIPSNVMEVEGNGDRCYDPELDIVSEVKSPAGGNERVCSAPRDHWMPMYVHYLVAGLRMEEKFFFVDDTEWSRRDAEVEQLSAWKAKKTKQNNYKLNEDEVEEVEKLVREEEDVVDIMYLTNSKAIEAAELYGPSLLSEGFFLNATGRLAIRKKPRKKSKTSNVADKGAAEKERLSSTSARALEIQQRLEPVRRSSEEVSEEVAPLQRKKRKVAEPKARGDEVVEFMLQPSPLEIDPEVRERKETEIRGPGKGKELFPQPLFQKSLFEATNTIWVKRFLNATLPEVDMRQARQEAVSHLAARMVRHALESASWEKEELQKEKEELQRKNKEVQRKLDDVVPTVIELQSDRESLSIILVFEECKRKICEDRLDAQDKYIEKMNQWMVELKKKVDLLVHNGMEEHIGNFLNSSIFKNIINLYRLLTAILAFTNCRKKVKAQYPEVDVTTVTFGEQEEGVEEDVQQLAPPKVEVPPLPTRDEPPPPPLPAKEQRPSSAD
ncbi:hypothetical protein SLEP1_g49779 [Rubroshorea leprosula]|uniref:Uncharacterized protein n=1 Tax=Rubroshorea leprosula TaxID=152421 RepID=A0AAV5LXX5_9ROSI|nr:hypothetical protein SLEP1_g49779 [Rubroshorea leprosula]